MQFSTYVKSMNILLKTCETRHTDYITNNITFNTYIVKESAQSVAS